MDSLKGQGNSKGTSSEQSEHVNGVLPSVEPMVNPPNRQEEDDEFSRNQSELTNRLFPPTSQPINVISLHGVLYGLCPLCNTFMVIRPDAPSSSLGPIINMSSAQSSTEMNTANFQEGVGTSVSPPTAQMNIPAQTICSIYPLGVCENFDNSCPPNMEIANDPEAPSSSQSINAGGLDTNKVFKISDGMGLIQEKHLEAIMKAIKHSKEFMESAMAFKESFKKIVTEDVINYGTVQQQKGALIQFVPMLEIAIKMEESNRVRHEILLEGMQLYIDRYFFSIPDLGENSHEQLPTTSSSTEANQDTPTEKDDVSAPSSSSDTSRKQQEP